MQYGNIPERNEGLQIDPLSRSPRILIVRTGAIGDTLMVTPLVRALRKTFPDAYLAFRCSPAAYAMLCCNPHLDRVLPLSHRHLPFWLSPEKLRALRFLRRLKLDYVLALESARRLIDVELRAGAARVIAYVPLPSRQGFQRAAWDPKAHSIENHVRAAEPLGVKRAGLATELYYPHELDDLIGRLLAGSGLRADARLVGIHAGWGGRKQPLDQTRLRSWPAANFAQLIQLLAARQDLHIVLTGSAADRELLEHISRLAGVRALSLAGKLSLLELAALIHRLDLYITVDSGPAHMAAALGTPLITLWGPGILEQTAPLPGSGPVCILRHPVSCAPCYGSPLMKTCQDNICMKGISVEEVLRAAREMLGSPEGVKHRAD